MRNGCILLIASGIGGGSCSEETGGRLVFGKVVLFGCSGGTLIAPDSSESTS